MGGQNTQSQQVKNPHDTRQKELFRNKDAFVSLLKDCVNPEWIDNLDINSIKQSETSFILQDFKKKEADIVYEATINNNKVIFYVLLELQSKIDYRMPYRLLLYITEILRHYYNSAEIETRKLKDFKFPAVIPIVFYSGTQKWTVPTNLKEMFNGNQRFGHSLINFTYSLVDVTGYDEDTVKDFQSRLLKVMMMLEKAENITELQEVITKYEEEIKKFNDEEMRIVNVAISILSSFFRAKNPDEHNKIPSSIKAKGVTGMFARLIANEKKERRRIKKQAKEEGREEGREEGKLETAREMLEMGLSVEQVAQATRWSVDKVIEVREASMPYR